MAETVKTGAKHLVMKTFVLALILLAPDGSKSELPVEMWRFDSMAECAKSSLFMNKGKIATAPNYACVEYDPSMDVAKIAPSERTKRRS